MRKAIFGMLLVVACVFTGVATVSASSFSGIQDRGAVNAAPDIALKVQGYCETLRRACVNKDALGERGEGNCRRYRAECGGGGWDGGYRETYRERCARLRRACLYKDERGEWGQGNCRRYRYECRGGW